MDDSTKIALLEQSMESVHKKLDSIEVAVTNHLASYPKEIAKLRSYVLKGIIGILLTIIAQLAVVLIIK